MLKGQVSITIEEGGRKAPNYDFVADQFGDLTFEEFQDFIKSTLIITADTVLKEELAKGFDKDYLTVVDGVAGKNVYQVKPFGKIEYVSKAVAEDFLLPIYQGLLDRSAVQSGLFVDSHFVFWNGEIIARNITDLKNWTKVNGGKLKNGDLIRFVNMMPYASKLEREGTTNAKGINRRMVKSTDKRQKKVFGPRIGVRAPNGTYFLTTRSIARKFKFNSLIRFEWINGANIDFTGVPTVNRAGKKLRRTFAPKKGGRGKKGSYTYPSITVRIKEEGLKE